MFKRLLLRVPYRQTPHQYRHLREDDQGNITDDDGCQSTSSSTPSRSEKMAMDGTDGSARHLDGLILDNIADAIMVFARHRHSWMSNAVLAAASFCVVALLFYGLPRLWGPIKGISLHRSHTNEPALFYTPPGRNEVDPVTGERRLRKALVMASYTNQDIAWIRDLAQIDNSWEVYRYISDLHPEDHTQEDFPDIETLKVARQDGREALAYLTFMIDKYSNLPDYVFFIHGHRYSWHQPAHIVDLLTSFNTTALDEEGFINLRCQLNHGCTTDTMYRFGDRHLGRKENRKGGELPVFWNDLLKKEVGEMPTILARPCCAQFAVTKETIRKRPRQFWRRLQKPLADEDPWGLYHNRGLGLFLEMVWHVLMGKPSVHCPPVRYCQEVFFKNQIRCACDGLTPCRIRDDKYVTWKYLNCTNTQRNFPLDSERIWMRDQYPLKN